ncbi:MAG TPA: glycosyltransferase family 39 protein [Anaerolineae bacterium]|nr:glycosyltransferase family 39 protein [Anaerolineae bacterium]
MNHSRSLSRRRSLHPLIPLLAAFAVLVVLHGWATPLFEAPDEVWHYAYVRWLAEGHGLPSMKDNTSGANQEVAQPPLYYAAAALLSAPFPDDDLQTLFWHNPHFGYQAPGTAPDNKNMLIHTPQEGFPGSGAVLAVRIARLTSLLFGLVTVCAAWGVGYEAFGNQRAALLTAALVGFHPQFVFMSSVVSNDSATAALSTATLWATARFLRRGITPRRAALAGALAGLAALTKTSALLLLPLTGLSLLWQGWRQTQEQPSPPLGVRRYRGPWRAALAFGLTALLVGGGWYLRNLLLYGDPLGMSHHVNTLWGRPAPVSLLALVPEFPLLWRSFWGAYGWGHVWWPDGIYVALTLLTAGAFLHGLYRMLRSPRPASAVPSRRTRAIYLLCAFWLMGIFAALLHWMRQVEAPHGRLLFPAIGAWAVLIAAGLQGSGRVPHRYQRLLLTLLVTLTLLAPGARILATFAPPKLFSPATSSTPQLRYGDEALLLSAALVKTERLAPGDGFTVRACWQAARPMTRDYTVFVQLLGPENGIITSRRTYPGLGRFPTSLWPVDRAFCDVYELTLPSQVDTPLRALLEIGLFDAATGERLPATAGDIPVAPPIVASVVLAAEEAQVPEPAYPLAVDFGEAIILRGYDRSPTVQAGQPLTVTLYWEAASTINEPLMAFVHLWEPGAATAYAQHDSEPRNGWFPTPLWQPGDIVPDTHVLTVPATLPPGDYRLWAGLYRAADGTRLPASEDGAPLPNALVPLGSVRVRAGG